MGRSTVSDRGELQLRKHVEQYTRLTDNEFAEVLKWFSFQSVEKETILIQPGEPVHYTYWVVKGLLYSVFNDNAGKEHIIQFAIENCWITDQQGFYNQLPAIFRMQALENSLVWRLSFNDREKLCAAIPAMGQFFRKKANDSFVKQQKRLLTYLTTDAQQRYDQLMQEYPGIGQRIPKNILAAYLGVSRETLSRFKKKVM
jgi:CRP-like cAMP-binding protein